MCAEDVDEDDPSAGENFIGKFEYWTVLQHHNIGKDVLEVLKVQ